MDRTPTLAVFIVIVIAGPIPPVAYRSIFLNHMRFIGIKHPFNGVPVHVSIQEAG